MILLAGAALIACDDDSERDGLETNSGQLMAPATPTASPSGPAHAVPTADALKIEPGSQPPAGTNCGGGLRGLSAEFPWARNPKGGLWMGTGYQDPMPLRKFSDEEILARAMNVNDKSDDRQHALVSVGRRKMTGALDALELALKPDQLLQVREMGLSGLIEHGGQRANELMWTAMKDDSSQIRGQAIWALALYGPDEAYRAIQDGLADDSNEVQGMALLAVWAIKDRPEVALPILDAAVQSDDIRLWQEGANVLGRMPYPKALKILERAARGATDENKRISIAWNYRQWKRNFPDLCP